MAAAAALAVWATPTVQAQKPAANASTAATGAPIPRTADGHPDFQGTWIHGTATPFERPPGLGDKAFYTDAEAAEMARQLAARRANPPAASQRPGDVGSDNEAFVDTDSVYLPTHQTSIVVDPPNGRIPFRPEAEKRRDFNLNNFDDFESMSPWDRCISRGPTLMLPAGYNNGTEFVQTAQAIVIAAETLHEARIVPLDGRPHAAAAVRSWTGDPRGRWEGDTLVVDSTNFLERGWIATHAGAGRLRGTPITAALHIVERFTMLDRDTIRYELTATDPGVFTSPWTASLLLHRSSNYQIYEYACHEGNAAIELFLRGARAEENHR